MRVAPELLFGLGGMQHYVCWISKIVAVCHTGYLGNRGAEEEKGL